MAHKKGGGSSRNGRDSKPKMLGVKVFGGQVVPAGSIIVRQRGTRFRPADGTGIGRDHTIFATVTGRVRVHQRPQGPPHLRARRGADRRLATPGGAGEGPCPSPTERRSTSRAATAETAACRSGASPRSRRAAPTAATAAGAAGSCSSPTTRWSTCRASATPCTTARRTAATARARCATGATGEELLVPVPPGTRVLRDGHVIAELGAAGRPRARGARRRRRRRQPRLPLLHPPGAAQHHAGRAGRGGLAHPRAAAAGGRRDRRPAQLRQERAARRADRRGGDRGARTRSPRASRRSARWRTRTPTSTWSPTSPGWPADGTPRRDAHLEQLERARVVLHAVDAADPAPAAERIALVREGLAPFIPTPARRRSSWPRAPTSGEPVPEADVPSTPSPAGASTPSATRVVAALR